MDAHTLRAALSAAIRVTVSTSLIGCGGNVTSDGLGDAPAAGGGQATSAAKPSTETKYPTQKASGGKSGDDSQQSTGGVTTGGMAAGGAPAASGGAGTAGSAGSPMLDSCEPVEACMTLLERVVLEQGESLPSAARACCELVVSELKPLERPNGEGPWRISECGAKIEPRFELSPATMQCCEEAGWPPIRSLACTPWGPPVPPELSLEALEAWELLA